MSELCKMTVIMINDTVESFLLLFACFCELWICTRLCLYLKELCIKTIYHLVFTTLARWAKILYYFWWPPESTYYISFIKLCTFFHKNYPVSSVDSCLL